MKLVCPCCGKDIAFVLSVSEVREWEVQAANGDWWREGLTPDQLNLAEKAKLNGLIDALKTTVEKTPINMPRSLERFFLTLLITARPKKIPQFALDAFIAEFGGHIQLWSAQGVGMVVSDGTLRMFVPLELVVGTAISRRFGTGTLKRMDAPESEFYAWIKTRMGYVPTGQNLFLKEMQRKTYGEFARPTL